MKYIILGVIIGVAGVFMLASPDKGIEKDVFTNVCMNTGGYDYKECSCMWSVAQAYNIEFTTEALETNKDKLMECVK